MAIQDQIRDAALYGIVDDALNGAIAALGSVITEPGFAETVRSAFGDSAGREATADLLEGVITGAQTPEIVLIDSIQLRGASGAYDSNAGVIYLSREFVAANGQTPTAIEQVILEEIGHYLDASLNLTDTPGDEGAVFAALVTGETLPAAQLSALAAEDDQGVITVDGRDVAVEFAAAYGDITIDGDLADWTPSDRLETPGSEVAGYALYGKFSGDAFVFALRADDVQIGANTTFWLNTDLDRGTGHKIWGFAGGAEYNINFDDAGVPHLYSGGDGQTLVASTLDYIVSADGKQIEIAVPNSLLAGTPTAAEVFVDVNNQVFLPNDYATYSYVVAAPQPPVPSETVGDITLDGDLSDWAAGDRLELPGSGVDGFELYGKYTGDSYVFAVKGDTTTIGANTTFWLNTDQDGSTGHQIWGFAGGAEYNVNFNNVPNLYTGAAGETLVSGDLAHSFSADHRVVEFSVPAALMAGTPQALDLFVDVNDQVFLPTDYSTFVYSVAAPNPGQTAETFGDITLDGDWADWTAAYRLEVPGSGVAGYELYGKYAGDAFVFGLKSDATAIGANTTFWLNTDQNTSTGHQIWGFTGGSEYNVNFTSQPNLYTGAAGETLVENGLSHAYSSDHLFIEFAVPTSLLNGTPTVADVLVDVNNQVFLPTDYASFVYTVGDPGTPPPPSQIGSYTLDGDLADWSPAERLDGPGSGVDGYEVYGAIESDHVILALRAGEPIGANTTAWFNVDQDSSTGHQIFGTTGGAEFNINFDATGAPALYTGAAGETLVEAGLSHSYSADGTVVEFAVDKNLLLGSGQNIDLLFDVNDQVFLPGDYQTPYTLRDSSGLPPRTDLSTKVAIVFSETTAANFFSETAYSQLFMAAQNQAGMAGVPFDVLSESDLTDISNLVNYDTIIFPSFRNVDDAQVTAISNTLTSAVYDYGIGLVTAGDFMTNDQTGAVLGGDPYARMKSLFGLTRSGGGTDDVLLQAGDTGHPMMDGYVPDEAIRSYDGVGWSHFTSAGATVTVLADQIVGGQSYASVVATETGGRNVHFSSEAMMGDNNMLWQALQWSVDGDGPSVGLQMGRDEAIVASRNDMDQSQETFDVNPDTGNGIYDSLLPLLEQWKADYDFVGSYYINVGNNPPDQETDWDISGVYYDQILALGNEIGTHSYTHPENTNLLSPAEIEFEFNQSQLVIEQQLGIDVVGAAVPGAPETLNVSLEAMQYFDYLTGGYASVGAGYPGAIGYLTPDATDQVYLAPNMSFDFTLIDFLNMTPAQAEAIWAAEWADLTSHADVPVVIWPWHDYGPTLWELDEGIPSGYTEEMFTNFIALAHGAGAEFVTLADLADRVVSFEQSSIQADIVGDTVTAHVESVDAGKFSLDIDGGTIARVDNWYAYDDDSVFLPTTGGDFSISLGAEEDLTHIVKLPARAELLSVTGDGKNLDFSILGDGRVVIALQDLAPGAEVVRVTGASIVGIVGDQLEIEISGAGQNDVSVQVVPPPDLTIHDADAFEGDSMAFVLQLSDSAFGDVVLDLAVSPGTSAAARFESTDFRYSADGGLTWTDAGGAGGTEVTIVSGTSWVLVDVQTFDDLVFEPTETFTLSVANVVSGAVGSVTDVGTGSILNSAGFMRYGTEANDVLTGRDDEDLIGLGGDDLLTARNKAEIVDGGLGNDTLDGRKGDDVLRGGVGDDRLSGGSGKDTLIGGIGADYLTGGKGDDTFIIRAADAATGPDTISDFESGSGKDTLDLSDLLVGTGDGAVEDFLSLTSVGADTHVLFDGDGAAGAQAPTVIAILENISGLDLIQMQADQNIIT